MTRVRLLLLLALCCTFSLFAADPVGMVLSVKGEVKVTRASGTLETVQLGTPIYKGDTINTGFQAFVQIDFLDHSKINLMGSSDVTIDDYFFDNTKNSKHEVSIKNGALGFMAGKLGKVAPENYEVRTAYASVGIRGSSGELQTSDGSLPGVPAGLSLMKTGGEALTVMPTAPEAPPLPDITATGQGIAVAEGQEVRQVKFTQPPTQSYSEKTEKKVKVARQEVAKQEAAKPAAAPEAKVPQAEGEQKDASSSGATASASKAAEKPAAPNQEKASTAPVTPQEAPKNEVPPAASVLPEPVGPVVEEISVTEIIEEIAQDQKELQEELNDAIDQVVELEPMGYLDPEIDDGLYWEGDDWPIWPAGTDPSDPGTVNPRVGVLPEPIETELVWDGGMNYQESTARTVPDGFLDPEVEEVYVWQGGES